MENVVIEMFSEMTSNLKAAHNVHVELETSKTEEGVLRRAKVCGDGCLFSVSNFKPGKGTFIHAKNAYAKLLLDNAPTKPGEKVVLKVSEGMFERLVEFLASDRIDVDRTLASKKLVPVKAGVSSTSRLAEMANEAVASSKSAAKAPAKSKVPAKARAKARSKSNVTAKKA